jgi:nitroreductase
MKTFIILALIGGMLISCAPTQSESMNQQTTIQSILTRTSVRQFTGEKISQEQIDTLLRCAMSAPSALNKQPWSFIVITQDSLLQLLGEQFPYSRCSNHPAIAIIPCGDLSKALEGTSQDFWINDVSAATENILLAAHAMGLGAVWTGIHPDTVRCQQLQSLLQLPEHIIPLCIVPIGVPAEQPEIKNKYNEENIHYNGY